MLQSAFLNLIFLEWLMNYYKLEQGYEPMSLALQMCLLLNYKGHVCLFVSNSMNV